MFTPHLRCTWSLSGGVGMSASTLLASIAIIIDDLQTLDHLQKEEHLFGVQS